ncbi:Pex12 amino terminal region-domain-containing protein [Parachaetomium inaequale]|uniref:RING-type E3 ubiquitin transferase n=1 Tax=Parachaetomium inaequale TaxID=2588326 RepID=A0AAN6STW3_9PEZI|nr:Pex12 amino terminal region-domain-containing protein [Parachaetomium inaequale]
MASQPPPSRPPPRLTSSPYPFAAAPDIIRAQQKDAYFQGVLTNQLSDLHRRLRGARSAHAWAAETRTFADALYLCLTTLLGNRTLGEEYCDLVQVEAPIPPQPSPHPIKEDDPVTPGGSGPLLPSLPLRAGYITTSILLPYLASRTLPSLRSALRKRLQSRLATLTRRDDDNKPTRRPSTELRVVRYLLAHLTPLTSGAHFHAVTLAVFYFTGAYYSLSKRIWGLRYVFTRRVEDQAGGSGMGGARAGYEVLGVLLVVQMLVRGWLHVREQLASATQVAEGGEDDEFRERIAFGPGASVEVSMDEHAFASNNELLGGGGSSSSQRSLGEIGAMAHTPVPKAGRARYDLGAGEAVMGWIKGAQQRKCTLCLEELKDPAATQCGHVFCWACIGDWVREKPECPLCRREAMVQHILPLRFA